MGLFLKGIRLPRKVAPCEVVEVPLPTRVILPLRQYIGEPARPVVSVGDRVKVGQLIGAAEEGASLPLHATIAGEVVGIEEHLDHRGATPPCVVIEADGTDSWVEGQGEEMGSLSPPEILERIRGAGVVLKGMLPIPLASDLLPPDQPTTHLAVTGEKVVRRIDTLLITALDLEPALLVNRYLAQRGTDELTAGLSALRAVTGAGRTVLVVDKGSPLSPQLTDMAAAEEETTTIISLDGRRFPIGLPVPLIKAALGREVPLPYGHPRDVGAALYDVDTVISVARGIRGIPQVDTLITVGGGAMATGGVVRLRIGTPLMALIESLGGFHGDPVKITTGGPMTGMAQWELNVPITKDIPAVFAFRGDEIELVGAYRECINCGLCVKVCPVNLLPGVLSLYCARDRFEVAERQGLFACIECGCCDYVCPSRRPLVHLFRHAKHELMEGRR
jgi:electron transport complex protein RnfC